MIIKITLKSDSAQKGTPKWVPHHKAEVATWFGLRSRIYYYLESVDKWVRADHYPVEFADDDLSFRMLRKLAFYLSMPTIYCVGLVDNPIDQNCHYETPSDSNK